MNYLPYLTATIAGIGAILTLIWIIVPVKGTLIPYARSVSDERIMVSRLASRALVFLFLVKVFAHNIWICEHKPISLWPHFADFILVTSMLIVMILCITMHPDHFKGL